MKRQHARIVDCGAGLLLAAWLWAGAALAVEVQFERDWSAAVEDIGEVPVVVRLAAPTSTPVTVMVSVRGGSADGGDYVLAAGLLALPPGMTETSVVIRVTDDHAPEASETVVLGLGLAGGGADGTTLGDRRAHTFTILDNDTPPGAQAVYLSLDREELRLMEDAGAAVFIARLDAAAVGTVTAQYETEAENAAAGGDFVPDAGTLRFAPGVIEQRLQVSILDNPRAETDETFRVVLTGITGALTGQFTRARCVIADDDLAAARFDPADGVCGEADGSFRVNVILDRPADYEVDVEYELLGTATPEQDYRSPTDHRLVFRPNVQTQELSFAVIDDHAAESEETVIASLTRVVAGTEGTPVAHTHRIVDNDLDQPDVEFQVQPAGGTGSTAVAAAWLSSGSIAVDESAGEGAFTLRLTATSALPITAFFALSPGTATPDADFHIDPARLAVTFAPGEREQTLPFDVLDDKDVEPDEVFAVRLTNAVNARFDPTSKLSCWLRDDDSLHAINEYLYKVSVPSVEPGRELVVLGSKDTTMRLRGLALDAHGNRYFTDQGPNAAAGEGSLVMWPAGQPSIVRLARGLTKPEDLELAPDGRCLLYATADGQVRRYVFGALIRVTGESYREDGQAVVYALTDRGPITADYLPEGYYHVPGLLEDSQVSTTIDVTIEHRGETKTVRRVPLLYPAEIGGMQGERMLNVEF